VSVQVLEASAARYFLEASASRPTGLMHDASCRQAIGIAMLWLVFYLAALIF
jgi:hypothetical protein